MKDKTFTWIPFYNELLRTIVEQYDSRTLVDLAYRIFSEKGLMDRNDEGKEIRLSEIEPCTFIARFNRKEKVASRIEYCRKAKEVMNLKAAVPTDFDGIPTFQNMAFWFIPYTHDRIGTEVNALWAFSKELASGRIEKKTFDAALLSQGTGLTYLTMICYLVWPDKFLPVDSNTQALIKATYSSCEDLGNWRKAESAFDLYSTWLDSVKAAADGKSFQQISHDAYLTSKKQESESSLAAPRTWTIWAGAGGESLNQWFDSNEIAVGWNELGDLIGLSRPQISDALDLKFPSERKQTHNSLCLYEFANEMKPGDLIVAVTELCSVGGVARITGDYHHDAKTNEMRNRRSVIWLSKESRSLSRDEFQLKFGMSHFVKKTLTKIEHQGILDWAMGSTTMAKPIQLIDSSSGHQSEINQIFVGPPGVGKTFHISNLMKKYVGLSSNQAEGARLAAWTQEQSWWSVVAAVLLTTQKPMFVNDIAKHPLMDAKIKQSSTKTPRNSIWAALQGHTVNESKTVKYTSRVDPLVFDKNPDSSWQLAGNWKEELADIEEQLRDLKSGDSVGFDRYAFVTFHQSYGYEDFVEGIRPNLDSVNGSLTYRLEKGIFRQMCERAMLDPDNKYAIFIDEINRGNISKIFGELITLIEADKRVNPSTGSGLFVTLPYSKEKFGVPANLSIIGTMNSVDRSLSVVDMALRRRFNFIRIEPKAELVADTVDGIPLRKLFLSLNQRISALLGPDYQLGHSYFLKSSVTSIAELKKVWFQQILPLVSEYLYGDWGKIKVLVGPFMEAISIQESDLELSRFVSSEITDEDFREKLGKLAA